MPFYSLQVYAIVVEVGEKTLQSDHEILGTALAHIHHEAVYCESCISVLDVGIHRQQSVEKASFDLRIWKTEPYHIKLRIG